MAAKRLVGIPDPELLQALTARAAAQGEPLGRMLVPVLRAWMALPAPPAKEIPQADPRPRKDIPPTSAGRPGKPKAVRTVTDAPVKTGPACRRCGHPEPKHWSGGCVMGCACARFQPPAAGK